MATTTNFGWETPDDTDLVKDGALAMRTLGNAIDASLVDLKGGTTGQVLSKTSNTDMDFTWVTSDDANAIQNAIVDAKGDLIAASAADTPARLAVGNNGETLVADSSTATGLKWAPSTPFVGCQVYNSTTQTIATATNTLLTFDSESIDTNGFHSTTTNTGRITIPAGYAGKYLIKGVGRFDQNATGMRAIFYAVNGSIVADLTEFPGSAAAYTMIGGTVILNLSAGDYVELYARQTSGGNLIYYGRNSESPFSVTYLGA